MRLKNNSNFTKHISLADGKDIHIYPKTEEEVPDELHYKVKNRIDNDSDLEVLTGKKRYVKKLTREEAYKMTKDTQVKHLEKFGVTKKKIPKYEQGRVNLILELQE